MRQRQLLKWGHYIVSMMAASLLTACPDEYVEPKPPPLECSAGFHQCGEVCLEDKSIFSCGTSCTQCTPPKNADATCDGTKCGFECWDGYHACGDTCGSNYAVESCGSSCTPCTVPENGKATCDGATCGIACNTGYHACGAACADDKSVQSCGASCMPCTVPENGKATCDGTTCGIACNDGYHLCGDACADNKSIQSCGSSCTPCGAPPDHATATCDGTTCGFVCDSGYMPSGNTCVPISAARLVGPLSTAVVTSRRPTLRWALAAGTDGARVELCANRACTVLITTFDVTGSSGAPSADLPVGVVFWRLFGRAGTSVGTTPSSTWQFTVGARSALHDSSWGSVLDVNGDGFADVVVGAPRALGEGVTEVYLGSKHGLSANPVLPILNAPDKVGSSFGGSVASAGDVNGDGYADVIVGASAVGQNEGRAYLYLGGANGLSTTPKSTLVGPDGPDGFFGRSVASAGDVNGDGYADVIVGAWAVAADALHKNVGRAHLYLGSPNGLSSTPATSLWGPGANAQFGWSVASAGDVNADGFADVIIGAPVVNQQAGAAYLYLGSASGLSSDPSTTLSGGTFAQLGWSVACAGDVNGDGYADVIVGALTAEGTVATSGAAYVHLGSANGLSTTTAPTTLKGSQSAGFFGNSVAAAGDVNGDGYSDVIVGAPYENSSTGNAYVYRGSASGVSTDAAILAGKDAGGYFGASVAGAGNVDGDHLADVIVGVWKADRAYLYAGTTAGVSTTPAVTLLGTDATSFGAAVASAARVLDKLGASFGHSRVEDVRSPGRTLMRSGARLKRKA